ncbi:hypothetical protein OG749_46825 (plasmid) [Streptomyces nojiriensis]
MRSPRLRRAAQAWLQEVAHLDGEDAERSDEQPHDGLLQQDAAAGE